MTKTKSSDGKRETLSWLLDILRRAAIVRMKHYLEQMKAAEEWVKKVEMDDATGAIIGSTDPYCAAHANLIFLANQTIEAFHGVLAASYYLSRKNPDLTKVGSILLDPTNDKGGIISLLRKKTMSDKVRFSLLSFPRIDNMQEPVKGDLTKILTPYFKRFEVCCRYSIQYWNILKHVRDAFAHNFRFIFYNVSAAEEKPQFDEAGLGLLPRTIENDFTVPNLMKDMVYVGYIQRFATKKLVSTMTMYETWTYVNMRNRIWNNNTPVIPDFVPILSKDDHERYAKIRESFGYDFEIPGRTDLSRYNKEEQENLHKRFMSDMQSFGDTFTLIDTDGRHLNLEFINEEKQVDKE